MVLIKLGSLKYVVQSNGGKSYVRTRNLQNIVRILNEIHPI